MKRWYVQTFEVSDEMGENIEKWLNDNSIHDIVRMETITESIRSGGPSNESKVTLVVVGAVYPHVEPVRGMDTMEAKLNTSTDEYGDPVPGEEAEDGAEEDSEDGQ